MLNRPILIIVAASIVISSLTAALSSQIALKYLDHHSYFYDPVGYYLYNARLYARLAEESRWAVAVSDWLGNPRHPLRSTPLVLFAPKLLTSQLGHLATALPMLCVFLIVLGITLLRRTNKAFYAVACMLLFCVPVGLLSPIDGFAVYWLDLHASFLTGAAALCLLNSSNGQNLRWLAAFAVFAACATLSRFVAGGYLFVMCGPILTVYLLWRWRAEHSFYKAVVQPVVLIGAIIGILAGYYLVTYFNQNINFYSSYGVALGHEILTSAGWVSGALIRYVGFRSMLAFLLLAVLNLIFLAPHISKWNWGELGAMIWLATSHILFLIFVLRLLLDWRTPVYAWPLLFLLSVSPVPWKTFARRAKSPLVLTSVVCMIAIVLGSRNLIMLDRMAENPSPTEQASKQFNIALAQAVTAQGDELVWITYFNTVTPIPTAEAYYRFGELLLYPTRAEEKTLFNMQEFIWPIDYPGKTPNEVSREIYNKLSQWVDVVVVFADPAAGDDYFDNSYTRTIARYVSQTAQTDPQWKQAFVIENSPYGALAGYRNLAPQPGAYSWLLQHYRLTLP